MEIVFRTFFVLFWHNFFTSIFITIPENLKRAGETKTHGYLRLQGGPDKFVLESEDHAPHSLA